MSSLCGPWILIQKIEVDHQHAMYLRLANPQVTLPRKDVSAQQKRTTSDRVSQHPAAQHGDWA
jgi:hypothetical protein